MAYINILNTGIHQLTRHHLSIASYYVQGGGLFDLYLQFTIMPVIAEGNFLPTDRGLCKVVRMALLKYSSIKIFPFLMTMMLLIFLKTFSWMFPFNNFILAVSNFSPDTTNLLYRVGLLS